VKPTHGTRTTSGTTIDAAAGADLFVCEGYQPEREVPFHLAFERLRANRERLGCERVVVTHMSAAMLEYAAKDPPPPGFAFAEDGLIVPL